jgi:hypothetical protein
MRFEDHVVDVADRGRRNFLRSFSDPRYGLELETLQLDEDLSSAESSEFIQTLQNIAGEGAELKYTPGGHGVPKIAVFKDEMDREAPGHPAITYDYGPQVELETQPLSDLDEALAQAEELADVANSNAAGSSDIYRSALLPSLQFQHLDFDDPFRWGREWNGEAEAYRNPALRYGNIEESYSEASIMLGGAGSIQFSAVPDADPDLSEVDNVVLDFMGAGDRPGIPALNPIFYGLTEASARITEEGLESFHGREDAYEERHCRSDLIDEEVGRSKFGYVNSVLEGVEEMESLEDLIRENSEKQLEYTAKAPLAEFESLEEPDFIERDDYNHYEEDDGFSLVLTEGEPVTHRDVVEDEEVEGYLRLETGDEEVRREDAYLDISAMDNSEEFLWRNYLQAESMNKPNIRPRMGYGCFENRDVDNNPKWAATIGIQGAKMRNWREFQQAAEEEGFSEEDAEYLREEQRRHGLDAELHPETDTTIRDFVGKNIYLFDDALYEPRARDATLQYLEDVTSGGDIFSRRAAEVSDEKSLQQLMARARL